jgi:tetratricopeptide (TPR) repeat protein
LAAAHFGLSRCYFRRGDTVRTREALDEAERIATQLEGDPAIKAQVCIEKGKGLEHQGELDQAHDLYERALALCARAGHRSLERDAHSRLAEVELKQGHLEPAIFHAHRSDDFDALAGPGAWTAMISLLDPWLAGVALDSFRGGDYATAVFNSFRLFEGDLRKRVKDRKQLRELSGCNLRSVIGMWIEKPGGSESEPRPRVPLTNEAEFCCSAYAIRRNPLAHGRDVELNPADAFAWIGVVHLMRSMMQSEVGEDAEHVGEPEAIE